MVASRKIFTYLDRIMMSINKIDSRLLIFLILSLNLLSFSLRSNEEAYFSLAKQYMDPSWISGSFTFTEWVGTRFLFQNIAGYLLKYLSFEQLAFGGRLINFLCYAFPLALIFKQLKINNLGILVILQIFILNIDTQHFFGKEWIFSGFESKTIAYIFVWYGYYFLLVSKFRHAAFFTALGSYFHILVGGWFFILVIIYTFIEERSIKSLFIIGGIYVLTVVPFVGYLALHITESGSIIHDVNIDWVYSFFRNTHHTAPMHTVGAVKYVLPRVTVGFALLLCCVFYFRNQEDENIRKVNRIAMISLCMVFVGLIITYIDVNGRILKYYLFRIASIGAFSYYLLFILFFREQAERYGHLSIVRKVVLILIIPFCMIRIGKNVYKAVYHSRNEALAELADYVKKHTSADDVFLFREEDEIAFSRLTRRESLVVFKFDPGGGEKIYEWYSREKMRRQLQQDITFLNAITQRYRLDFLITRKPVEYQNLSPVFHNNQFYLYKVNSASK